MTTLDDNNPQPPSSLLADDDEIGILRFEENSSDNRLPSEENAESNNEENSSQPLPPRPTVQYVGTAGQRCYVLLYPVNIDGRTIERVVVNHPALWDVQDWLDKRLTSHFELIARMTELDVVALGALRWPDMQALLDMTVELLPSFIREAIEAQGRRR